jgi:hypothetical protein
MNITTHGHGAVHWLDVGFFKQHIARLCQYTIEQHPTYLLAKALDISLTQLLALAEEINPLVYFLNVKHNAPQSPPDV